MLRQLTSLTTVQVFHALSFACQRVLVLLELTTSSHFQYEFEFVLVLDVFFLVLPDVDLERFHAALPCSRFAEFFGSVVELLFLIRFSCL